MRPSRVVAAVAVGALPLLVPSVAGAAPRTKEGVHSRAVTYAKVDGSTSTCLVTGRHEWTAFDDGHDELVAGLTAHPSVPEHDVADCEGEVVIVVIATADGRELGRTSAFATFRAELLLRDPGEQPYQVRYSFRPDRCDSSTSAACTFHLETRTK